MSDGVPDQPAGPHGREAPGGAQGAGQTSEEFAVLRTLANLQALKGRAGPMNEQGPSQVRSIKVTLRVDPPPLTPLGLSPGGVYFLVCKAVTMIDPSHIRAPVMSLRTRRLLGTCPEDRPGGTVPPGQSAWR